MNNTPTNDPTPNENNHSTNGRPARILWPRVNVFFRMIWAKPATHIAKDLACSQPSVVIRAHRLFGDLVPGRGFWQKKNRGLNPEIPPEVVALQAKLDAEANLARFPSAVSEGTATTAVKTSAIPGAAGSSDLASLAGEVAMDKASEVKPVACLPTTPTQVQSSPCPAIDNSVNAETHRPESMLQPVAEPAVIPAPVSALPVLLTNDPAPNEVNNSTNGRAARIPWPRVNVFFCMIWGKPATHIAKNLAYSQASVVTRAHRLFGDLVPGHGFWQKKNHGLNAEIPPEVVALQAKLDAEANEAGFPSAVSEMPATAALKTTAIPGVAGSSDTASLAGEVPTDKVSEVAPVKCPLPQPTQIQPPSCPATDSTVNAEPQRLDLAPQTVAEPGVTSAPASALPTSADNLQWTSVSSADSSAPVSLSANPATVAPLTSVNHAQPGIPPVAAESVRPPDSHPVTGIGFSWDEMDSIKLL